MKVQFGSSPFSSQYSQSSLTLVPPTEVSPQAFLPRVSPHPSQKFHLLCSSCRKVWGDPSKFRPERFLTADGTAINKTLSEKVILFGMGKRRCIGEVMAKSEIFLFLAILLQRLEFSVPAGVKVDLTPIYGLTMKHPHCEHVQARPRFSTK